MLPEASGRFQKRPERKESFQGLLKGSRRGRSGEKRKILEALGRFQKRPKGGKE